jgi:hypothetical protein
MTDFVISNLQDASILALNDMRESILINPDYQREGGVWSRAKKQLFIDSLINRYDVPKFYFHLLSGEWRNDSYAYSVIDGRQRLEAIWEYIAGDFALSRDTIYNDDPMQEIRNLTYPELARRFPRIATRFNARSLTVMVVTADDLDFIEDMFTRLNEAVPLNAAEKRNSFGGPLPRATRALVQHPFLTRSVPIPTTRYRHHDIVAKLLYLEWWYQQHGEVSDTKKASVDTFFRSMSDRDDAAVAPTVAAVTKNLDDMAEVFTERDALLKSPGMVAVYYLLFSILGKEEVVGAIERSELVRFEEVRAENRNLFENEEEGVDFKLIEYDELAQSSNDAAALAARLNTLRTYLDI